MDSLRTLSNAKVQSPEELRQRLQEYYGQKFMTSVLLKRKHYEQTWDMKIQKNQIEFYQRGQGPSLEPLV